MSLDPRELLVENLALIRRAVAFVCRRSRFDPADAEEFAAVVNFKLIENDYAVLRSYEGRSGFSTWISIVVQRMALDYRISAWGKWHTSAEAKRLGSLAIELEQLLHRDGRALDDALTILAPKHEGLTRESIQALAERLPQRAPRRRLVDLEEAALLSQPESVDDAIHGDERRRVAHRLSAVLSDAIRDLPDQERLILQLRFEGGMTVAQIARSLQIEQKLLYRRIEQRLREMRKTVLDAGLDPDELIDLIGRDDASLDFQLGKRFPRPSKGIDEGASARPEASP